MDREPEVIAVEIKKIERIISKSRDKPGLAVRVQEAEKRLAVIRAELETH